MTYGEFDLLQLIVDNGGGVYEREVVREDSRAMQLLVHRRYVRRVGVLDTAGYIVTDAGETALAEYLEAAQQKAEKDAQDEARHQQQQLEERLKERRQHIHDYRVAAFQCLVSFLLGLIAEHYLGIASRILALLAGH